MAIKIKASLHPRSFAAKEHVIVEIEAWTTQCGRYHGYSFHVGDKHITGRIPKHYSGHRNMLHLMSAILAHADIDSLGRDYFNTPAELGPNEVFIPR
ncbi:MAG: hypothetical protein AB7U75_14545 [Hyphomicrobiaceae bacterium]